MIFLQRGFVQKHLATYLVSIAIVSALIFTGCKTKAPKVIVKNTPETSRGEASFQAIVDSASTRELPKNQSYQRARAKDRLTIPIYPHTALKGKFGSTTVAVRIIVDTDGKVSEIADSPLRVSTPGPYAADFRSATEEAIRSWTFEPAEIHTLEDGKDLDGDGKPDYRVVTSREKIKTYFDLVFDFKIIKENGQVKTTVSTSSERESTLKGKEKK
jgi:hypothetical protein